MGQHIGIGIVIGMLANRAGMGRVALFRTRGRNYRAFPCGTMFKRGQNVAVRVFATFPVTFEKVKDFETCDDRFTKVKIWLMHLGQNLNNSAFEKSVVDKAIPTLQYIPIMGFVELNDDNEKDFSDHRYVITKDEYGVRRKYMGSSYGVIKSSEDNNAHYEMRLCDDGVEREFLVVDGLMWNMFEDSSRIINQDIVKGQSMELYEKNIQGYEDEDGLFHFTDFSFRAACILGDGCTPAMTGSTVEVQFTMSDFVKSFQSELEDKYTTFTKLVNEKNNHGGAEDMSKSDFAQTALQQFEDISTLVMKYETTANIWGDEVPRFYAVDIQENEVIVVDRNENYNYYGFSFIMNGDKPEIDFASGKRKKISYEDYVEGVAAPEGGFEFGKFISDSEEAAFAMVEEANAKVSEVEEKVAEFETKTSELEEKVSEFETAKNEIEEKYNQINAEFEEMKPKYEDYVAAEQARIEAELDAQKDAEFAKYETILTDNVEFEALKEKKAEMTVKDIESELAIMFARKTLAQTQTDFSKAKEDGVMVAGLIDNSGKDGFVETKYGYIPVRK